MGTGNREEEAKSIDPRAWGEYVSKGRDHFDRVVRSFNVFVRNAQELQALIVHVETDAIASLMMAGPGNPDDIQAAEFQNAFWSELDQRLHNTVSGAVSLVDHTRPLVKFYIHEAEFTKLWQANFDSVASSQEARFLRRLRNYLLHFGMAPVMHTIRLGPSASLSDWDNLAIQLSPEGLLLFDGWNANERAYIRSFESGGPALRPIADKYVQDMNELYKWLFDQYPVLHKPGVPPKHLYG